MCIKHRNRNVESIKLTGEAIQNVEKILVKKYSLSPVAARMAINHSPMKKAFSSDPLMAAHMPNETWAKNIYLHWSKLCSDSNRVNQKRIDVATQKSLPSCACTRRR
ncbi:hypothetical protein SDC9_98534 [bioreactor metagenome]|uniref:Uncharacterized protein n=1 Tax=bioreactor metagenome TaxID=1076179 RepID=A0A645ALS2_9ZZZZ